MNLPDKLSEDYHHQDAQLGLVTDRVNSLISYLSEKEKEVWNKPRAVKNMMAKIIESLEKEKGERCCDATYAHTHDSPPPVHRTKEEVDASIERLTKLTAPQSTDWEEWFIRDWNAINGHPALGGLLGVIKDILSRKEAEFMACVPEGARTNLGGAAYNEGWNACRAQMFTNLAERK